VLTNRACIGVAGRQPAARRRDSAARGVDSDHELSNPIARVSVAGRVRGVVPRSNVSTMIMRPPQHGQPTRQLGLGLQSLRLDEALADVGAPDRRYW